MEARGTLLGIARREATKVPMEEIDSVEVSEAAGLAGDFRGRTKDRQVTVLAREAWEAACRELGRELSWTTRRANLLVEGLDLVQTAGAVLRIGDVRLAITQETDPCAVMDRQCQGLRQALTPAWRGGVSCRVEAGGRIRRGDPLVLERA